MDMSEEVAYYSRQSAVTDPGPLTPFLSDLPASVPQLCEIVHGVVAHRDHATTLHGLEVAPGRRLEAETRYVDKILERIVDMDPRPLITRRDPAQRFLGSCRDFATLLSAMLRYQRVPARLRCGFAAYWTPGVLVDHWVCEYWDSPRRRWLLADPEIGDPEREAFQISLDRCAVPRDQFIAAGRAWQMCRRGTIDPNRFGVHEIGVTGLWFVRSNVLRDLAALNRIELLPWDYTEFFDRQFREFHELPQDEVHLLDRVSEATGDDPVAFQRVIELYRDAPQVQVDHKIRSYTIAGPQMVTLRGQQKLGGVA